MIVENYRFKLPFNLENYIPFYGGAEHHDYHHYIGGQSHSNFAPVFTHCDYIYGTDKVRTGLCNLTLNHACELSAHVRDIYTLSHLNLFFFFSGLQIS